MQGREDSGPARTTIAGPAAKRLGGKGRPPPPGDALGALGSARNERGKEKARKIVKPAKAPAQERTRTLNFRVSSEFRRAFKQAAAAQHCKKVELLEHIFNEWHSREPA